MRRLSSYHAEGGRALAQIQVAWNAAARSWDVGALADIYAPDALFFGGRPGHAVGRDQVRSYFASYADVIDSAVIELKGQQLLHLADGVFLAQGFGEFRFLLAGGKPSYSVLRTTLLLVRHEDRWQIRQHHFSESPAAPPLGER